MAKLLRTKMIQHSYTVGLCKNRRKEAQFRTKCSVLIFYDILSGVISHVRLFLLALRNPWQMLAEPFCSAEPRLKITAVDVVTTRTRVI